MSVSAVLFDLDGTLLPMDQEAFTRDYFKALAKKLAPLGVDPKKLVEVVWAGTGAMVRNRGPKSNCDVFWDIFTEGLKIDSSVIRPVCDEFYVREFNNANTHTGKNPLAKAAVEAAHEAADKVILASNPIFPLAGHVTRMSWVGLKPEDFDYITSYESECACKPNPAYYLTICEKLGLDPADCVMIGNDELEDMYAASSVGIRCFLITDCMIPSAEHPWTGPKGTFPEMVEFLRTL